MHNHHNPEILIGASNCLLVSTIATDQEHIHGASVMQSFNRNFVLRPLNSDLQEVSFSSGQASAFDQNTAVHQSASQHDETIKQQSRISGYIIKSSVLDDTMLGKRLESRGITTTTEIKSQLKGLIPVEELSQLSQRGLRENFIQRVCVMHRWQQLVENEDESIYPLIRFHKRHSHLYQSHDSEKTIEIKAILSQQDSLGIHELYLNYIQKVMEVIKSIPSSQSHVIALRQLLSAVESFLSHDELETIHKSIESYQSGEEVIKIPLTLLRHYAGKYSIPELMNSVYLFPYPQESLFLEQSEVAIAI